MSSHDIAQFCFCHMKITHNSKEEQKGQAKNCLVHNLKFQDVNSKFQDVSLKFQADSLLAKYQRTTPKWHIIY